METEETLTNADKNIYNTRKTHSISHAMVQKLIEIQESGYESAPRGLKVRELELAQLNIDPMFSIPDFEQRPFNWRYFMGELSWYMSRDCDIDWINNFSNFWKNISDGGSANSNYGAILFGEQLQWAKDALLQDPQTRQGISFVNQPRFQYAGNKDFVCTMYINFWIRDGHLNMKVQMRSNDVFYGLTYDAPFFATLMQTMWYWLREKYTDLQLGAYYHCADNLHYYERHFELAESITEENASPANPTFFLLREPLFYINNGHYILSERGTKFLTDVSNLVHSGNEFGQEESKEIINKYFYIQ